MHTPAPSHSLPPNPSKRNLHIWSHIQTCGISAGTFSCCPRACRGTWPWGAPPRLNTPPAAGRCWGAPSPSAPKTPSGTATPDQGVPGLKQKHRCSDVRHLVWNRNKDIVTWDTGQKQKDVTTCDTWSEIETKTQWHGTPGLKQKQGHSNERNLVWNRNKDEATWVTWSEAQTKTGCETPGLKQKKKKMQRCETETKTPGVKQKQRHLVWNRNKDTWCEAETKMQWCETPGLKQKQRCSDVKHLVWKRKERKMQRCETKDKVLQP